MPCDGLVPACWCHRQELKDNQCRQLPAPQTSCPSHLHQPPVPHISTQRPESACGTSPQQSFLRRDQFRETWQACEGPGSSTCRCQLQVPGCRLPVQARLQVFQQRCPGSRSSPVCCRIRPLCTTAVTCCRPALGKAKPLLQYALKLKYKLLNTRHVKQNLIFDLPLCPTLLPLAPSPNSLRPSQSCFIPSTPF